jgi:hypothetical protein
VGIYRPKYRAKDGEKRTSKVWWASFRVGGRRVRCSLETRDKRVAKVKAAALLQRAEMEDSRLSQPDIKQGLPSPTEPVSDADSPAALGSGEDHQDDESGGSAYLTSGPEEHEGAETHKPSEATEGSPLRQEPQTPGAASSNDERQGEATEGREDPTE